MKLHPNQQAGFGLFEILITIIIVAIGLLGLAAMQATGLKNNESAYRASQATVLAYDMADRMRANMAGINSYLSSTMTPSEAKAKGIVANCKSTVGCTTTEMAQTDLAEWATALSTELPSATGTITGDGTTYAVTLSWDDDLDGAEKDDDDPTFQVSFQP